MENRIDTKRLLIYLGFAFGIAWLSALVIYLTGGLANSPVLVEPLGLTLALVLMAGVYMWAPAAANVLTRLITGEGWKNAGLRLNIKRGWPYWLAAWFLPPLLTSLGAAIYFVLFPAHFDANLSTLREMLASTGQGAIDPWFVVISQVLLGILASPLLNGFFTFGEEFGWRAYMLPKLMPLGSRKAMLVSGIIWGAWHWPVIFMGYEYGLEYPGAPVVGPLLFLYIATLFGVFLSWVTLRGGSVWPAVIGHAAINGFAAIGSLFTIGEPNPLLGPLPVGVIGSLGWAVVAVLLFNRRGALEPAKETAVSMGIAPEQQDELAAA